MCRLAVYVAKVHERREKQLFNKSYVPLKLNSTIQVACVRISLVLSFSEYKIIIHFKKDNELFIDNTKIIYSQKQEKRKEKLLIFSRLKTYKRGIRQTIRKTILLRIVKPIFKTSYKFNVCNSFYL